MAVSYTERLQADIESHQRKKIMNMRKVWTCIITILILLLMLTSCADESGSAQFLLGCENTTIKIGQLEQIVCWGSIIGNYYYVSDLKNFQYVSEDPSIATVDETGLVTGVAPGVVTIHIAAEYTAKQGENKFAYTYTYYSNITMTVISPASIADINIIQSQSTMPSVVFPEGYTGPKTGTLSIDDPSIASIGTDGRITGLKPGTTIAHFNQRGAIVSFGVTVESIFLFTPSSIDAIAGIPQTVRVTYNARYSGGTQGKWTSSDLSLVSVSAPGVVTGLQNTAGSAVLTYTVAGVSGTVPVTVRPLFSVLSDTDDEVVKGYKAQLSVSFDSAYTGDTAGTWVSSDDTIATISEDGKVKGIKAGTATVTFTHTATGLVSTREIKVILPEKVNSEPKAAATPAPTPTPRTYVCTRTHVCTQARTQARTHA